MCVITYPLLSSKTQSKYQLNLQPIQGGILKPYYSNTDTKTQPAPNWITAMRLLHPLLYPSFETEAQSDLLSQNQGKIACVVGVPFNRFLSGESPDQTNSALAAVMLTRAIRAQVPILAQFEHAEVIKSFRQTPGWVKTASGKVELISFPHSTGKGEWVQTHKLMAWIAQTVKGLGKGNRIVLVCKAEHARRCAILARHYGLDPVIPDTRLCVPFDPTNRPGAQWWCKTFPRYLFWEYCLARPKLILDVLRGELNPVPGEILIDI